jgi:hypothetical protein
MKHVCNTHLSHLFLVFKIYYTLNSLLDPFFCVFIMLSQYFFEVSQSMLFAHP